MKAVLQRVCRASVEIDGQIKSRIEKGFLVYLAVEKQDTEKQVQYIANKIVNLRIFSDEQGKMNRSLIDVGGQVLLISNFTLYGNCSKGRMPGFDASADPYFAESFYEKTAELIRQRNVDVKTGKVEGLF